MQTSWDLLFLDTYGLVPLKLSAVGSPDRRWPESSRNLQRLSAVSVTVQQFWGAGWRGGCSGSYICKAGGRFKMYLSILIAVF